MLGRDLLGCFKLNSRVSAAKNDEVRKKTPPTKLININTPVCGSPNSNNTGNTAIDCHLRLLREEIDCDVTFIVGQASERIQCHQLFLKARSPVFQAMFSERWKESSREIKIPDIDPDIFRAFLEFVYDDKFHASLYEALDLLYVAQKYDVQLLVQKCEKRAQSEMKLEDTVAVFQLARKYGNEKLMRAVGNKMAKAKSLEKMTNDDVVMEMDKQTLTYLLNRHVMEAKEVELFNIALKWGESRVVLGEARSVKGALSDIIPLIRFPTMKLSEFTSTVVPTDLLKQEEVIQIFSYLGSDERSQKEELEKKLAFSTTSRQPPRAGGVISLYDGALGDEESTWTALLRNQIRFNVRLVRQGKTYTSKGLAISGIILRCPVKVANKIQGQDSTGNDFRISIIKSPQYVDSDTSADDVEFYPGSCSTTIVSPVRMQWGQEMEVQVEPPASLESGEDYVITLQHLYSDKSAREENLYRYRDLGELKTVTGLQVGSQKLWLKQVRDFSYEMSFFYKIRVIEQ